MKIRIAKKHLLLAFISTMLNMLIVLFGRFSTLLSFVGDSHRLFNRLPAIKTYWWQRWTVFEQSGGIKEKSLPRKRGRLFSLHTYDQTAAPGCCAPSFATFPAK